MLHWPLTCAIFYLPHPHPAMLELVVKISKLLRKWSSFTVTKQLCSALPISLKNGENEAQRHCKIRIFFFFKISTSMGCASHLLSVVLCPKWWDPSSLASFWMHSITHKTEGLIVICYSLGSTYTWKNFTETLSAKSSLDKIDDDKCFGSALLKQMEEVAGHFAWLYGFQVSEWKHLGLLSQERFCWRLEGSGRRSVQCWKGALVTFQRTGA